MAADGCFYEQCQDGVLSFIPTHPGASSTCAPCSQDLVNTGKHLNGKAPKLAQTPDPKDA